LTQRVAGSFRDPAGFVFTRDGVLYRQVNRTFAETFAQLSSSGLYDALVEQGLLIPHATADVEPAEPATAATVIRPEPVDFVSYPFEWAPGQLRAAALATLEAQRIAMDHGMTLRDATAYNVQFHRGRPVLIDTLSFEPLVEGRPWVAYRQFCEHFLAPLALMHHVDVRLGQLQRAHLDGIPLDLAAGILPARTRMRAGLAIHIHAHAGSQRRHADAGDAPKGRSFSMQSFQGLIESLTTAVRKLEWSPPPSAWRDYYAARESYSDQSLEHKEVLVDKVLAELTPQRVWDLGANTGHFSRIAARHGAQVASLEMDPSAVELSWRQVAEDGETAVLPLWVDLANPTPSQGWAHGERMSLTARGPADAALALALVHHLAIGGNVPLPAVAEWFAQLCEHLIVEWIPKDDPMVQRLLASREDVFADYTQEGFESAFGEHFSVERREPLQGSVRLLYVMRRRART